MKRIENNIYLLDSGRYHIRFKGVNETYDTRLEARERVYELNKQSKNNNHEYPDDFIEVLFGKDETINLDYIEKNFDENIEEAMKSLTEREAFVVKQKLVEGYTFEAIALQIGVTRERVRQILNKAIRRLKTPSRLAIIRLGKEVKESQDDIEKIKIDLLMKKNKLLMELENPIISEIDKNDFKNNKTLDFLDLSIRTHNALRRSGIRTIYELLSKTYMDLIRLRSIGNKSLKEIIYKLEINGLKLEKEK